MAKAKKRSGTKRKANSARQKDGGTCDPVTTPKSPVSSLTSGTTLAAPTAASATLAIIQPQAAATPTIAAAAVGTIPLLVTLPIPATVTVLAVNVAGTTQEEPKALSTIWEDDHCLLCSENGKGGWKCLWCHKFFLGTHHTRAVAHFAKRKGNNIAICKVIIPEAKLVFYIKLYNAGSCKVLARKLVVQAQSEFESKRLVEATASLATGKRTKSSHNNSPLKPIVLGVASLGSSKSPTKSNLKQPSITASMQNVELSDIRGNHNSQLQMAIADFFHCENIPDGAVESGRFATMLNKARLVGNDFKIPNRRQVGGELLEHNYKSCSAQNLNLVLKDAHIFGLTWMSDGATIARMPLVNTLVMCSDVPPTVVDIHDCTEHMSVGGKKDAEYLAGVMEVEIEKYDPKRAHTDLFYFDGASNVQKGGLRLCALYPRAYVFHGGEHVISLFFSGVAKIPPIKVCMLVLMLYVCVSKNSF